MRFSFQVFLRKKKLLNTFDDPIKAFNISCRSGTELSFFGANASIWPDLYSGCVANLGNEFLPELRDSVNRPSSSGEYKLDHVFVPPHSRMPHEVSSEEVSFACLSVWIISVGPPIKTKQIHSQEWTGQSDRGSLEEEEVTRWKGDEG